MHSCIYRPLTVQETQRLFANTCLSTSHHPDKWEDEPFISPLLMIDYLIGFMRIPYLYVEAEKVCSTIRREDGWWWDGEFLAVIANSAEILIWAGERHFIVLGKRSNFLIQGICYISRMVLYERAVYLECRMMMQMWREGKKDRSYQKLKVQLISHTAYLGWVTLNLITHINGKGYPRQYMKFLHIVSIIFGGIASCYNPMPKKIKKCLNPILPQKIV